MHITIAIWHLSYWMILNRIKRGLLQRKSVSLPVISLKKKIAAYITTVAQTRYDEIAVDNQAFEPLEADDGRGSSIGVTPTRIAVKFINLLKSITGMVFYFKKG